MKRIVMVQKLTRITWEITGLQVRSTVMTGAVACMHLQTSP